jgi:RNA polymerase sigma-70 factor (sigma-E family)
VTTTTQLPPAGPEPMTTFEAFYRSRYRDAVRLAYVMTSDPDSAEDVAQEALMRVRPRFASLESPWPYTRAAIINGARSHLRGRNREWARLRSVAASQRSTSDLQPIELLDAIDRLPFRQKAVIVLRFYEDLPESEIAEALGCRPGTVKSLSSRALSRLAQEIKR